MKFQIGDAVQVGARIGTIIDVSTGSGPVQDE
jgi:hypothetical protein